MINNFDNRISKKGTVLSNLDKFDMTEYEKLRVSTKFESAEKTGKKHLSTYPELQRDIWGSLYKYETHFKNEFEIPKDLLINKSIIEHMQQHPEFKSMKEYTKLDDLASALGTIQLSNQIPQILDNISKDSKELQKKMEQQLKKQMERQNEADTFQQMLDQLEKQLQKLQQQLQDGQNQEQIDQLKKKQVETKKKMVSAKRSATNYKHKAEATQQELQNQLHQDLNSGDINGAISQAVQKALKDTRESQSEIESYLGGDNAGKGLSTSKGNKQKLSTALKIFDYLESNSALKKIIKMAGNLKKIGFKKRKVKYESTSSRKNIEMGNDIERIIPSELVMYHNSRSKKQFLKKFAEGELLQYSRKQKEKLGEGPIVICKDISSSMKNDLGEGLNRAQWATACTFAVTTKAWEKNRKVYIIEFESTIKNSFQATRDSNSISHILSVRYAGGTNFQVALNEAFKFIEENKDFKKSDIVFITDGAASIHDKESVDRKKEKNKTSILTIQLASGIDTDKLENFSDKIIKYTSNQGLKEVFDI